MAFYNVVCSGFKGDHVFLVTQKAEIDAFSPNSGFMYGHKTRCLCRRTANQNMWKKSVRMREKFYFLKQEIVKIKMWEL